MTMQGVIDVNFLLTIFFSGGNGYDSRPLGRRRSRASSSSFDMHVSSSSDDMHVSPSSCDMEVSPSTGHGARLVYPPPHLTCMYHPPRMTCMYPPPQDMVHVTLRARPTTAGPSTTSASSSWTSPQPLSASRQCTSLLMLKVKDFFLMYIVLYAYIYVYVFM